jgi:hypothetical protein
MREPVKNMGASVRARLLNLAKERNQPNELLLTRYALERLLYRLSKSKHRERFVLKGAMLMTTWFEEPFRPTRDLDLLGLGDADPQGMLGIFREICALEMNDGAVFDTAALEIDVVRDELAYGGLRIKTYATIGGARVRIVIDIGFGDAVEPGITELELPVLLDLPAPLLRAYRAATYSRATALPARLPRPSPGAKRRSRSNRRSRSRPHLPKIPPSDSNGCHSPKVLTRKCRRSPWWSRS